MKVLPDPGVLAIEKCVRVEYRANHLDRFRSEGDHQLVAVFHVHIRNSIQSGASWIHPEHDPSGGAHMANSRDQLTIDGFDLLPGDRSGLLPGATGRIHKSQAVALNLMLKPVDILIQLLLLKRSGALAGEGRPIEISALGQTAGARRHGAQSFPCGDAIDSRMDKLAG